LSSGKSDEDATLLTTQPPENDPRPEEADTLLANEMNRLSVQERENIMYDLHAILNIKEETPEFCSSKLEELEKELSLNTCKPAFDMAFLQDPTYVQNRGFRLMFLRSDNFDAKKTAARLIRHFASKLELFGAPLLCKNITQDDLSEGELECLYSGYLQQLPFRDRAGRIVLVLNPNVSPNQPVEDKVLVITCFCMHLCCCI
jgi:hypothetical protein